MGIPFFQKKPSDIQRQFVMVRLTDLGKKEAENFTAVGNKEFEVLAALNQKTPQSIGGLAKEAQISFGDCLRICKELKLKGMLEQVSRPQ